MNRRNFFSLLLGAATASACPQKRIATRIDASGTSNGLIKSLPSILRANSEAFKASLSRPPTR
jgi:hypothetical protein